MTHRSQARVLAAVALIAVGIYSISCKPAWSPEGDEVAYIGGSQQGDQLHSFVAIYDLKTKENRIIAESYKKEDEAGVLPFEVFWPKRGHELVIVYAPSDNEPSDRITVARYDLKTKITKETAYDLTVKKQDDGQAASQDGSSSPMCPMLLRSGRWLWLQGDSGCSRVDLKNGKVTRLKQAQTVFGEENKPFYAAEGPEDSFVVGSIKTFLGLREIPLFTIRPRKGESIVPILAARARHTRFACIRDGEKNKSVEVFDEKGRAVKEILLPESIEFDDDAGAGAEWSSDSTRLWLTVSGTTESEKDFAGLAEIGVADGSVRVITINEDHRYGSLAPLHLSLSPNGSLLAVSVVDRDEKSDGRVGLCLVDVAASERTVTLIPPLDATVPAPSSEQR